MPVVVGDGQVEVDDGYVHLNGVAIRLLLVRRRRGSLVRRRRRSRLGLRGRRRIFLRAGGCCAKACKEGKGQNDTRQDAPPNKSHGYPSPDFDAATKRRDVQLAHVAQPRPRDVSTGRATFMLRAVFIQGALRCLPRKLDKLTAAPPAGACGPGTFGHAYRESSPYRGLSLGSPLPEPDILEVGRRSQQNPLTTYGERTEWFAAFLQQWHTWCALDWLCRRLSARNSLSRQGSCRHSRVWRRSPPRRRAGWPTWSA